MFKKDCKISQLTENMAIELFLISSLVFIVMVEPATRGRYGDTGPLAHKPA